MGFFITTGRVHLVVEALQSLDQPDLSIVGFDIISPNQRALTQYKKLFLINQNPGLQGYYGTMELYNYILQKKRPVPQRFLPLDIVTLENVENYLHIDEWEHFE